MKATHKSPLLVLVGSTLLSLALVGCGSGGYSKPNTPPNQPPMYPPAGASSLNHSSENAKQASVSSNNKVQNTQRSSASGR